MAKDFAVIQTGGKQYKVSAGDKLKVEKLGLGAGETISFETVLLRAEGGAVHVGAPYVSGVHVEAKILGAGRGEKKLIFKYHPKTRARRKKGHRQEFTELEIVKI